MQRQPSKSRLNPDDTMLADLDRLLSRWNYDVLGLLRRLSWMRRTTLALTMNRSAPADLVSCLKTLVHRFDTHVCHPSDMAIQSKVSTISTSHLREVVETEPDRLRDESRAEQMVPKVVHFGPPGHRTYSPQRWGHYNMESDNDDYSDFDTTL